MITGSFVMNPMVPEIVVRDWQASRAFYCDLFGFKAAYERAEEGFSFLTLGEAQLMICELEEGAMFGGVAYEPQAPPFGRGLNLQIQVNNLPEFIKKAEKAGLPFLRGPEEKWYRRAEDEIHQRQFVIADPDGYLLRFCEVIGTR